MGMALSLDDLKKLGDLYWQNTWAQIPGKIAADPRLAELQAAAQSSGINFNSLLQSVPVTRSGSVLSTAQNWINQYAPKLTPVTSEPAKTTVAPNVGGVPQAAPQAIEPLNVMDQNVMKQLSQMYFANTWDQVRTKVAADPQLRATWDKIRSIGYDPEQVLRSMPYNASGQFVQSAYTNYQRLFPNLGSVSPESAGTVATQQLQAAGAKQQLLSPTGPTATSTGPTTPHAPVNAAGMPQSTLTGQSTVPNNMPAGQAITAADLSKTGVSVGAGGTTMTTSPTGSAPQTIDMTKGLNPFNPGVTQQNLEELQLSRLPTGQLIQQQQNQLNAMNNQPKPDIMAQEQERLQSPFKIRQAALDRFRSGALKPA